MSSQAQAQTPPAQLTIFGLCADVEDAVTTPPTGLRRVFLNDCDDTFMSPKQKWNFDANERLVNGQGYCLESDNSNGSFAYGTCHTGNHQKWVMTSEGKLRNKSSDKYLTVDTCSGSTSTNPTGIIVTQSLAGSGDCNTAQIWTWRDPTAPSQTPSMYPSMSPSMSPLASPSMSPSTASGKAGKMAKTAKADVNDLTLQAQEMKSRGSSSAYISPTLVFIVAFGTLFY